MYMYVDPYTVKPGDTLNSIAQRVGLLSYTQILRVNREILNPNRIYPGQIINVPKITPLISYIVKPGDTLGNILYQYNLGHIEIYGVPITIEEFLAYNPAIEDLNRINAGMTLYLPEIL